MRTVLFLCTIASVVALAFWAYRENYATREALAEAERLRDTIRAQHSRLAILRAEWAYLNRPDRLRALANAHFDELGLFAIRADQFGRVVDVPKPRPETPGLVDVALTEASQ